MAGRPDRSRHRPMAGHIHRQYGYPTPPPSAGSIPGTWPNTFTPPELPPRPRSMPAPPVSVPILHNGEPAIMGSAEPENVAGPPHPSTLMMSPPPSRANIPLPPTVPSYPILANGEPSMIGADESATADRTRHLSETHELTYPNAVPPAPVSRPFTTQLNTVLNFFREADVEELSQPEFPQRVISIFSFAADELDEDPDTYNREYRLGVRELAEYMAQNFQLDTREYWHLL